MLIGRKTIDMNKLKQACSSPQRLIDWTISIIPPEVRHVRAIVDNQKYYVATHVRAFKSIPYPRKMQLCDSLLAGVEVKGVCNELYDYEDLLSHIDLQMFQTLLDMEEQDAKR